MERTMLKPRYTGSIYIAINRRNARAYIGKTLQPVRCRRTQHKCAAVRRGGAFYAAIRKHGWNAFVWFKLFSSDCEESLFEAERQLIADYRAAGIRLYNIGEGGEGQSVPCSDERRRKVAEYMRRRRLTAEQRQRISARMKGNKLSPASIEKMRQTKTGKKLQPWSDERRRKFMASWEAKRAAGYCRSKEARARLKAAALRRAADPAERARLAEIGKAGRAKRWGS
jgi:hypothetical protein